MIVGDEPFRIEGFECDGYPCFFRPGFYPWQIDDRSLTARA